MTSVLLSLLAVGFLCCFCDAYPETIESITYDSGGRRAHTTKYFDRECHGQISTTEFDDDTSNNIVDDLDKGLGLILFSEHPGTCYIRDVKAEKQKCLDEQQPTKGKAAALFEETVYEQVEDEIKLTDLPEDIRKLCVNRTIIGLKKQEKGTEPRVKRQATLPDDWFTHCKHFEMTYTSNCQKSASNCHRCTCVGWLFRKRTCKTCCDTTEHCKPVQIYKCTQ